MQIPDIGFLRLKHIIGCKKSKPSIPPILPIGKTSWWKGIKEGRYPAPIKISPRITVWRVQDIRELCEKLKAEDFK